MNKLSSPNGDDFKLLLQERIKNFWGYGNLGGDIWFVGMEEGYNQNNEILIKRLEATAHSAVFDIYDDLKVDPGHVYWFEEGAPTQPTYRSLIYILLHIRNGKEPTLEEIREYQIKRFGRKTSDHAVLELMPLPSKSIKESDWLYANSGIEGLSTRKEYLATHKPARVRELRTLIQKHKPRLVLFYSKMYLSDWQQIANIPLEEKIIKKLYTAKNHDTLYAVVPHTTSFGMFKSDWKKIAEALTTSFSSWVEPEEFQS
jgi:hypothetical protein